MFSNANSDASAEKQQLMFLQIQEILVRLQELQSTMIVQQQRIQQLETTIATSQLPKTVTTNSTITTSPVTTDKTTTPSAIADEDTQIEVRQCKGMTKQDKRCNKKAYNSDYCNIHKSQQYEHLRCNALTKSGVRCSRRSVADSQYCSIHSQSSTSKMIKKGPSSNSSSSEY